MGRNFYTMAPINVNFKITIVPNMSFTLTSMVTIEYVKQYCWCSLLFGLYLNISIKIPNCEINQISPLSFRTATK